MAKKFRDLFVISEKWLGLIWNYFQIPGAFTKICGLRADIQEVRGPFCKVAGIKEFPDLIYNGKFCGLSPQCGGPTVRSGPCWTMGGADTGRGGALPVHGVRARGLTGAHRRGTTERGGHREFDGLLTRAQAAVWRLGDGGEERLWLEVVARVKEGAKRLEKEGIRCGEVWGWCSPFIGAGGAPGRGGRGGGTVALMSVTPLKTVRLRRGLDGGAS
jgi:hypothetical protein